MPVEELEPVHIEQGSAVEMRLHRLMAMFRNDFANGFVKPFSGEIVSHDALDLLEFRVGPSNAPVVVVTEKGKWERGEMMAHYDTISHQVIFRDTVQVAQPEFGVSVPSFQPDRTYQYAVTKRKHPIERIPLYIMYGSADRLSYISGSTIGNMVVLLFGIKPNDMRYDNVSGILMYD